MVLIASVSRGSTIFQIISAAALHSILEIVLALSLLEESEGVALWASCICGQPAALSHTRLSRLNRMPLDPKSGDRIISELRAGSFRYLGRVLGVPAGYRESFFRKLSRSSEPFRNLP